MDKGYSDYENHPDWNTRILSKIERNTEKILELSQNKSDINILKQRLGEINAQLDILSKKYVELSSAMDTALHSLELIVEYTQLYKDGTIEDYRGHLRHINSLAKSGIHAVRVTVNKNV